MATKSKIHPKKGKKTLPKKTATKNKGQKMADLELPSEKAPEQVTASQLIEVLKEKCTEGEAVGFILTVIGQDGAIVPFVGGRNLGEILVMEKLIAKEINRILESQIK
jgi:hypothetical protein